MLCVSLSTVARRIRATILSETRNITLHSGTCKIRQILHAVPLFCQELKNLSKNVKFDLDVNYPYTYTILTDNDENSTVLETGYIFDTSDHDRQDGENY